MQYDEGLKISLPHSPFVLSSSTSESRGFPPSSHPVDSFEYGVDKLRGKKLVIIGDSISRYRYINLVYYIANSQRLSRTALGNSSDPDARNPNNENTYKSWEEFFADAGGFLKGRETCDCYRNDQASPLILENRHYVDEQFDIAFYLLLKERGYCTFQGRRTNLVHVVNETVKADWCYSARGFLSKLADEKSTDYLWINQGLHSRVSPQTVAAMIDTWKNFAITWLTTTNTQTNTVDHDFDKGLTDAVDKNSANITVLDAWKIGTECFEKSGKECYWNNVHFMPVVYEEMLRQTLLGI